jgi:hypothetical protein
MFAKLYERLNGKGCIAPPRTLAELKQTLQLTVNASKRYANLDLPEGMQNLNEVQALERELTAVLYRRIPIDYRPDELKPDGTPNVELDNDEINRRRERREEKTPLDDHTMERAEELLVRLDLLGRMSIAYMLRATGRRTKKSIKELLPEQFAEAETEAAQMHGMQLSET